MRSIKTSALIRTDGDTLHLLKGGSSHDRDLDVVMESIKLEDEKRDKRAS